jgi:hypothetical protein
VKETVRVTEGIWNIEGLVGERVTVIEVRVERGVTETEGKINIDRGTICV